jgi:hypothetical protein
VASNVAPPKNTGGGGFVFEDDVCAWLLASMLVGEPVFDLDCGALVRLDFQTRPDGWFLDDVLITTSRAAAAAVRLRTLPWFLGRLQHDEEHSLFRDEDAEDDLAKLLNVVWDQDQSRLRSTTESFAAFRGLLAWLVECQNALGLELQGRIGGLK